MNYKNIKYYPSNKYFHLTKKGLDELKEQLDHLGKEKIKMSKRLINMDVKEKEEFITSTDAISHLDNIELKVSEISDILQRADIIPDSRLRLSVGLGSTVFLRSDFQKVRYTLVNSIEADPSANKISEESPLGRALIGKTIHSIISVVTPRGKKYSYKVLAVK